MKRCSRLDRKGSSRSWERVAKKEESDRENEAKAAEQKKKAGCPGPACIAEKGYRAGKGTVEEIPFANSWRRRVKVKAAQATLKKKLKAQETAIAAKAKEKMDAALARAQAEQRLQ